MDYADATIVCLAKDIGAYDIITFDQKDLQSCVPPCEKIK